MVKKDYGMYEVLIGVLNNFPESQNSYRYDAGEFDRFFFNNSEKYSVLNEVAFDSDGLFPESKELDQARYTMNVSYMIYSKMRGKESFSEPVVRTAFNKFHRNKFNEKELGELEKLSEDFRKEFCD
jgi:hypothetical protein